MNKYINLIKIYLTQYKKRREMKSRLKLAEKILDIKLVRWQKDFILKRINVIPFNDRRQGTTLVCELRFLIWADPTTILYLPRQKTLVSNITGDPNWHANPYWHVIDLGKRRHALSNGGLDVISIEYTYDPKQARVSVDRISSVDILLMK